MPLALKISLQNLHSFSGFEQNVSASPALQIRLYTSTRCRSTGLEQNISTFLSPAESIRMSLLGPMESLYGSNCYGVPSRIFECALLYTVPNSLRPFYIQTHSATPQEAKIHACRCIDWAKLSEALREDAAANEDIPDHVRMQVRHAKSSFGS
jgi:hypothetical protein